MNKVFSRIPMNTVPEVVVVGAGPTGSFAALNLAKLGVKVTIFEEHEEVGIPSHCAGHLSIRSLRNLGLYPLPGKIIENTFSQANFYSPKGNKLSIRFPHPVTCAMNRTLFDKLLAEKAQAAGVQYYLASIVRSLLIENGSVKGVNVEVKGELEKKVKAKVVIDAEGVSSRLLKQTGLLGVNPKGLVYTAQAEVENVENVQPDAVEVYLGREHAPGFYAWLIPRLDGTAKVGLATRARNPKTSLQRLMLKHPVASKQLGKARVTGTAFHAISLGGPISKAYAEGFLAVGDAASQVKPTTGGGVIFGLICARIAAEVAHEAIQENDIGSTRLQTYQKRLREAIGFDADVMLSMRRFLDNLSDEQLERALQFFVRIGLDKTLENVEEIDFQGRTFLALLNKPAMWVAMAYFLKLYLSANT